MRHAELFQSQNALAASREFAHGCRTHATDADHDLVKDALAHGLFVGRRAVAVNC
jgi:hypothetical protein